MGFCFFEVLALLFQSLLRLEAEMVVQFDLAKCRLGLLTRMLALRMYCASVVLFIVYVRLKYVGCVFVHELERPIVRE